MNYKIQKRLLGGSDAVYDCPGCGESLISPLEEAGQEDACPHCGESFVVPGEKEKLAADSQQKDKDKLRAAEKEIRDLKAEQARLASQAAKTERQPEPQAVQIVYVEPKKKKGGAKLDDLIIIYLLALLCGLLCFVFPPFLILWVPLMTFLTFAFGVTIVKRLFFG